MSTTPLDGPAPTAVQLQPMAPPTQWERAGNFSLFWDPNGPVPFQGARRSHRAILAYQQALLDALPGFKVGLSERKHEPPRRFRVTGRNIRHGARLELTLPADPGETPVVLRMPLFPTDRFVGQSRIWETAVEADGEKTMSMLNGGPNLAHVYDVLVDPDSPNTLDPAQYNSYGVVVVNITPSGDQPSAPVQVPLTIQDTR